MEIYKTLVVSTAHLTPADLRMLEDIATERKSHPLIVHNYEYGVRVLLTQNVDAFSTPYDGDELSAGAQGILATAKILGCRYIEFDRDGGEIEGFPKYNW